MSLSSGKSRTRAGWFAAGVVASGLLWLAVSSVRDRPQDHSPSSSNAVSDPTIEWLKRSRSRTVAPFTLIASADPSHAAAIIQSNRKQFPGVVYGDDDSDGVADSLAVTDASGRHWTFSDKDGNGHFEEYSYATGIHEESIVLWDGDLDGTWDERIGPGRDFAVRLGSEWHDVTIRGKTRYVEINGEDREVVLTDGGVWEIVE